MDGRAAVWRRMMGLEWRSVRGERVSSWGVLGPAAILESWGGVGRGRRGVREIGMQYKGTLIMQGGAHDEVDGDTRSSRLFPAVPLGRVMMGRGFSFRVALAQRSIHPTAMRKGGNAKGGLGIACGAGAHE